MPASFSYLPEILPAYIAYLVAVASPGPAVMAIIVTSMTQGRRAGMLLSIGIFAGAMTWAFAAALGLAALLTAYAELLVVLKTLGGVYLLYLAYKSFRASRLPNEKPALAPETTAAGPWSLMAKGYVIHVTNPKAIFTWLALITLGMPQGAPSSVALLIVGICGITGFCVFNAYAILFSTQRALRIYRSMRRGIESVVAAFYAFAGIKLLTSTI